MVNPKLTEEIVVAGLEAVRFLLSHHAQHATDPVVQSQAQKHVEALKPKDEQEEEIEQSVVLGPVSGHFTSAGNFNSSVFSGIATTEAGKPKDEPEN